MWQSSFEGMELVNQVWFIVELQKRKLRFNQVGGYHPHNKDARREAVAYGAITAKGLVLSSSSSHVSFDCVSKGPLFTIE